jgi:hypothetical protein
VPFTTCGNVTGGNLNSDGSGDIDVQPTCTGVLFVMVSSGGGGPPSPGAASHTVRPIRRSLSIQ